jgi:hypothetical protein
MNAGLGTDADAMTAAANAGRSVFNDPALAPAVKKLDPLGNIDHTSTEFKALPAAQQQRITDYEATLKTATDNVKTQSSLAYGLVNHTVNPNLLSKRGANYTQQLQQANALSIARTGQPFNLSQSQMDYNNANATQTQFMLKKIMSVQEPNGVMQQATAAASHLPNVTDVQTINRIFSATGGEFGNVAVSNFHTAMLGLADDYGKIMTGTGGSSDSSRDQALKILQDGYAKGQMQGAVKQLHAQILATGHASVGDNPYLQRQYPDLANPETLKKAAADADASSTGAKPAGKPTTTPPSGVPHDVIVNGVKVGTTTDGGKTMQAAQ